MHARSRERVTQVTTHVVYTLQAPPSVQSYRARPRVQTAVCDGVHDGLRVRAGKGAATVVSLSSTLCRMHWVGCVFAPRASAGRRRPCDKTPAVWLAAILGRINMVVRRAAPAWPGPAQDRCTAQGASHENGQQEIMGRHRCGDCADAGQTFGERAERRDIRDRIGAAVEAIGDRLGDPGGRRPFILRVPGRKCPQFSIAI